MRLTHQACTRRLRGVILMAFVTSHSLAQRVERVYANPQDSTTNMYLAIKPTAGPPKAFMVLLDGFGASPANLLQQTNLPTYAAQQGILTIISVLETGPLYFGGDSASQQSLTKLLQHLVSTYHLQDKDLFLGGFSIGGSCAVKYAELALQHNYAIKPKAVFAVDPPLDWERFYTNAKRVTRLAKGKALNGEVSCMIERIEKEMKGSPQVALASYHALSPYSYSDTTQWAIKPLVDMPIMLISEPDVEWWLSQRGYDYTYINAPDQAAMINELQQLGNQRAVLVTTRNKGYRQPGHKRHPHSWSIADAVALTRWLLAQK